MPKGCPCASSRAGITGTLLDFLYSLKPRIRFEETFIEPFAKEGGSLVELADFFRVSNRKGLAALDHNGLEIL